mmetsp:Transcript_21093/g.58671  ORF Transcript_21093/g.58671 Transcript_21093/m.58671 type:complete len:218 (-) Transcript_21093:891-1544(-)
MAHAHCVCGSVLSGSAQPSTVSVYSFVGQERGTALRSATPQLLQFVIKQFNAFPGVIEITFELLPRDTNGILLVLQGHFQYLDISFVQLQKAVSLVLNIVVCLTGHGTKQRNVLKELGLDASETFEVPGNPFEGLRRRLVENPFEDFVFRLQVLVHLRHNLMANRSQFPPAWIQLQESEIHKNTGSEIFVLHLSPLAIVVHALAVGILQLFTRLDIA